MMISRAVFTVKTNARASVALKPSSLLINPRPFSTASPQTQSTKQQQQDDNNAKPSGCPHPNLKHVPALPLVGSMIPQHSGLPKFELGRQYENNSTIRERFGSVMTLGFPGFGVGWRGKFYYIFSPSEVRPTMMFPLILLFLSFVLSLLT